MEENDEMESFALRQCRLQPDIFARAAITAMAEHAEMYLGKLLQSKMEYFTLIYADNLRRKLAEIKSMAENPVEFMKSREPKPQPFEPKEPPMSKREAREMELADRQIQTFYKDRDL